MDVQELLTIVSFYMKAYNITTHNLFSSQEHTHTHIYIYIYIYIYISTTTIQFSKFNEGSIQTTKLWFLHRSCRLKTANMFPVTNHMTVRFHLKFKTIKHYSHKWRHKQNRMVSKQIQRGGTHHVTYVSIKVSRSVTSILVTRKFIMHI